MVEQVEEIEEAEEIEEVEEVEEVEETGEVEEVEKKEGEVKKEDKDSDTFTLPEDKPDNSGDFEIVHNGNTHKFTKEKVIELAQKGFDYDTKVGPHGKIAQMIEADPGVANVVNEYFQKKAQPEKFEIKPMDDYKDEAEWLGDNLQRAIKSTPTPQPVPQTMNVMESLKMRDPEHCNTVLPKLGEYASRLSVRDYQRIDQDMGALCQFYDFVKGKEVGIATQKEQETPGFRVKSGGGASKKADAVPVWKLSKADFQKQLDKIKGY